jgi:hypothetical protein
MNPPPSFFPVAVVSVPSPPAPSAQTPRVLRILAALAVCTVVFIGRESAATTATAIHNHISLAASAAGMALSPTRSSPDPSSSSASSSASASCPQPSPLTCPKSSSSCPSAAACPTLPPLPSAPVCPSSAPLPPSTSLPQSAAAAKIGAAYAAGKREGYLGPATEVLVWRRVAGQDYPWVTAEDPYAGPSWPVLGRSRVAPRGSFVSSRRCVAADPFGAHKDPHAPRLGPYLSCEFTNLYLGWWSKQLEKTAAFIYVHEVTPGASPAEAEAEVAAVQADLALVSPYSSHWMNHGYDQIKFTVVGFEGNDAYAAAKAAAEAAGTAVPPDPNAPGGAASLPCECDEVREPHGDPNVLVTVCHSDRPSCYKGRQVNWPSVLLLRETPPNIGHWTWDNLIPVHSAMEDLGLGDRRKDMQLIMYDLLYGVNNPTQEWVGTLTRDATYAQYKQQPMFLAALFPLLPGLIRFRTLVTGFAGRTAHEITPLYSTYNADKRVIWKYRHSVLDAMDLLGADHDYSKGYAGKLRILLVQKPEKRRITNIDAVKNAIMAAAAAAGIEAEVPVLDWRDLGGFRGEVTYLLDTNIMVSMDGTGANNLFFMPPGSVHVSLGVRSDAGHANQADFLFSGVDHIRVLYFCCQQPGDHQADTELDLASVTSTVMRAARYVRKGFEVPVPFYLNHAQTGFVCQHLYHKYPSLVVEGREMYIAQSSHFCRELRDNPEGMWNRWVTAAGGPAPPKSLRADVAEAVAAYDALHKKWDTAA